VTGARSHEDEGLEGKKRRRLSFSVNRARIAALGDRRGETLSRMRAVIEQADSDEVEAVKWRKPSNAPRRATTAQSQIT
jgi:hypothetical protein